MKGCLLQTIQSRTDFGDEDRVYLKRIYWRSGSDGVLAMSRVQRMPKIVAFHKSGAVAHVPGMSGTCVLCRGGYKGGPRSPAGPPVRQWRGGTSYPQIYYPTNQHFCYWAFFHVKRRCHDLLRRSVSDADPDADANPDPDRI